MSGDHSSLVTLLCSIFLPHEFFFTAVLDEVRWVLLRARAVPIDCKWCSRRRNKRRRLCIRTNISTQLAKDIVDSRNRYKKSKFFSEPLDTLGEKDSLQSRRVRVTLRQRFLDRLGKGGK